MTGPRVAFLHVTDPRYRGGGADRRAEALSARIGNAFDTSFHVVEVEGPVGVASLSRLRLTLTGVPPRASQAATPAALSALDQAARGADAVVASTLMTAALVPRPVHRRMVFDAHNLEWQVTAQLASTDGRLARRLGYRTTGGWTRAYEAALARRSARVWAVSRAEADWFSSVGATADLIPNGVDLPPTIPAPSGEPELLFVGSLASSFNRAGLAWFLEEVWPRVRRCRPDATLSVVGAGPDLPLPPGAARHGFVADLEPFYRRARLAVAPILGGSGTRLKVLEAMAFARPVVATAVGAAGLEVGDGDGVLIADGAGPFSAACLRLLDRPQLATRLGTAARAAAARYSWDRVGEAALASMRHVLQCASR